MIIQQQIVSLSDVGWSSAGWRCQGPGQQSDDDPDDGNDPPGDGQSACSGTQVFRDDFSGSRVNSANWRTGFYWNPVGQANPHWAGDNQSQTYVDSLTDPVFSVSGGTLSIKPRKTETDYLSGSLTAQAGGDNKEFSRGCYEIRAKFPDAPGSFPAFWLISAFGPEWTDASGAKNRPEIDVVETIGEPNRFYTTGHNFGPANNRLDRTTYHPVDRAVSGAFHTYSVRWSDSAVICYFDGQEVFRESARTPQTSSIYLHLNFALGDTGHWAGPVDDTYFETSPKLEVDYVLVTQ